MILYHLSNTYIQMLTPQLGGNRHLNEESGAVGKKVIWFCNKIMVDDPPSKYLYTVDIDDKDPNLFFATEMNELFIKMDNSVCWYYYTLPVTVINIAKWTSQGYK